MLSMVIVMELLLGQGPLVVYDKVQAPQALLAKVMVPVEGLITKPDGVAEKVPPDKPVTIGVGLAPVWQQVPEEYTNAALSAAVIVTKAVSLTPLHCPLGGILFVTIYVPGAVLDKSISPVLILTNDIPIGLAENTPALAPVPNTGNGLVPF